MAGESLKLTAAAMPSAWKSCFSVGANSLQKGQPDPKHNSMVVFVGDTALAVARPAKM